MKVSQSAAGQPEVAAHKAIVEPAQRVIAELSSAIEEQRLRGFVRAWRNAEMSVPCQGGLQGREGCGRY